jgi:hypothetical protein
VVKNVNLVIVKAVQAASPDLSVSHIIAAWAIVAADIEAAGLGGRAVVTTTLSGASIVYFLNIGNSELMTALVRPAKFTPDDRLAYIQSIRDVINLDVPVVVASGTINVRFGFLLTKQHSLTINMTRNTKLATRFLPTLRCL